MVLSKTTAKRNGVQTFGVFGPRVRSGPFEGPAHGKPPALPGVPDSSTSQMLSESGQFNVDLLMILMR